MTTLLTALLLKFGEGYISRLFSAHREKSLPDDVQSVVDFFLVKGVRTIGDLLFTLKSPDPHPDDNWRSCVACKKDGCDFSARRLQGRCWILNSIESTGGHGMPSSEQFSGCPYRREGVVDGD